MNSLALNYIDPFWLIICTVNHVQRKIFFIKLALIKKIVQPKTVWYFLGNIYFAITGVLTGITNALYHFWKSGEFVVDSRGVVIEQTWSNYNTDTSLTVTVNITGVPNPLVVIASAAVGNTSFSAPTLNGSAATVIYSFNGGPSMILSYIIPATTGVQNVVSTCNLPVAVRCQVYLLSGVDQSNPILNSGSIVSTGVSVTTPTITTDPNGLLISTGGFAGGTVTVSAPDVGVTVNSIYTTAYSVPAGLTATVTWNTNSSSAGKVIAACVNPE